MLLLIPKQGPGMKIKIAAHGMGSPMIRLSSYPNELFQHEYLDLQGNYLTGYLPTFNRSSPLMHLNLWGNDFRGSIPASHGNLSKLTSLEFGYNKFQSQIPDVFGNLNKLTYLNLALNSLQGPLPPHASGLQNLQTLHLEDNLFIGTIPSWPFTKQSVDHHNNSFTALTNKVQNPNLVVQRVTLAHNDIHDRFLSLDNLSRLDLSKNNFSGFVKLDVLSKLKHLWVLDLSTNKLLSWSRKNLQVLDLRYNLLRVHLPALPSSMGEIFVQVNKLTGEIPASICTNNKLSDTFPHWLGVLPDLQVLIMRFNRFHVPLNISKDVKSSFSSLQIVDLFHNEFTGSLPLTFFRNLDALKDVRSIMPPSFMPRRLLFGSFNEDGQISVNITSKKSEMVQELARTLLIFTAIDFSTSPAIFQSLGNIVQLESLDLSSNKLSGRIPSQLTNLTFLEGNLGLCGFPLTKQCGSSEGPKRPAKKMREVYRGSQLSLFWKLVMEYGRGVDIGISTTYIGFNIGRPWWLVRRVEGDWQRNVTSWVGRIQGKETLTE
ncbi:hypothetical protein F3Y22_tig00116965pilonHSYRG00042 [Hibiscus syriacus]|uniref:Uncharacterized protein n=1 Tax=Hibiscus syriacus TaxID=106335 RepID=A0A6A2WIB4_HIBSY|nr:hypothetical protein F3Y22_tig00116965pilonHSYRG00042 [Hibiscus syriacus]